MRQTPESTRFDPGTAPLLSETLQSDLLSELGRATTAYHDASPDRVENARQEYEEALRRFKAMPPQNAAR